MSSRVPKSAEAEQKVACIALQGLCMVDSQSGYYPEGNLKQIKNAESLFKGISEVDVTLVSRCTLDASSHFLSPTRLKKYKGFKYHELFNIVFISFFFLFLQLVLLYQDLATHLLSLSKAVYMTSAKSTNYLHLNTLLIKVPMVILPN